MKTESSMFKGFLDARLRGHDDFGAKRDFFSATLILISRFFKFKPLGFFVTRGPRGR